MIRNRKIGVWCLSVNMAILSFSVFGCGGGDKAVPTVDVPKGGKDSASRDISNPLETKPGSEPAKSGK